MTALLAILGFSIHDTMLFLTELGKFEGAKRDETFEHTVEKA